MKRTLILAAAAALILSSCEKKEQFPVNGDNEVKFAIEGPVTRVTTTSNTTAFEVDDVIEITSEGLVTDLKDTPFTVGESGLTSEAPVYYDGENAATFVAHYPATAVTDASGNIQMTVAADQTTDEKFHANMFMVAQAEGAAAENEGLVTLSFEHQFAMIKVIVSGLDDADAVTVNGVVPDVKWTKGGLTAGTAEAINVKAWKQSETQEYWAIVPAQTFAAATKFITVNAGTKTYEYTLGENALTVSAAKVKTVTLTITEAEKVKATFALEDTAWTDDEEELTGEATEKIEPPVELISADFGDFTKVTLNDRMGGISSVINEGWCQVGAEANAVVAISEGALTITASTTGSSWFNRAVVCRTPAGKTGTYTLTFTAKASVAADLQLAVMVPEAASNTWYKLGANTSAAYCPLTTEWAEKTYQVDLSTVSTGVASPENGVLLILTPKTIGEATFSIKDVTLIENK